MKQAILLHNPGAGDEDHLKEDLVKSIEKEGFGCTYFSVKEDAWKKQLDNADFAIVAGGDGTVRRVTKELVKRDLLAKKLPLALLPMGTANNLSKTLGLDKETDNEKLIHNWTKNLIQNFDVGIVKNADATDFFMESVGFGVFPHLMKKMKTADMQEVNSAKEEIKFALEVFVEIIKTAKSEKYRIKADGVVYEGDYLLLEIMNIKSIGPNLLLAPNAEMGDGVFDVVFIEEDQREDLILSVEALIADKDTTFKCTSLKAKELIINSESKFMHVDDELIIPMKNPISIEARENLLEFMV